jgi:hypothetical protein
MTDATARLTAALAGRYRLERELGQGGMATVYLARDLKHERDVAIKVLKPELGVVLGADILAPPTLVATPPAAPFDSGQPTVCSVFCCDTRRRISHRPSYPLITVRLHAVAAPHLPRGADAIKPEHFTAGGQPVIADWHCGLAEPGRKRRSGSASPRTT